MERLTYKSISGGYGSTKEYDSDRDEILHLRNALGKYEDLGLTPEEIGRVIINYTKLHNNGGANEV